MSKVLLETHSVSKLFGGLTAVDRRRSIYS